MKMMQRIQENLSPWWGLIISVLIATVGVLVSVCIFFISQQNEKINKFYEHAIKQELINQQNKEHHAAIQVRFDILEKSFNLHVERENERHWELKGLVYKQRELRQ